jgi:2-C-methyl-D-erythritol 4-phosphate cytidylyltransferase / 2-C-methyl-D-erythritol 2,4-cyclodiphosphate synthase
LAKALSMTFAAIIVAAGKGERAGSGVPKQFRRVAGTSLVARAVDSLRGHPAISHIIVVIGAGQHLLLAEALGERRIDAIVTGGASRQDSVWAGLNALSAGAAPYVLIHDAARAGIPSDVISRLHEALRASEGAVPVLPVVDTLSLGQETLGATVPRDGLWRVQTPQAFRVDAVMTSHRNWQGDPATDDAQMARAAGFFIAMVEGDSALDKLTHPQDFARLEAQMQGQMISRTAFGYDVHRLEAGQDLWLGGVLIPHDKGLAGHSDADVALHALTDALLGTIGAGDIGMHFPPSDAQWRGARSSRFVEHACDLIRQRGGLIDHVDVTIVCEAPKIGPHRGAITSAIAAMLAISETSVSVKATTTEGLGFTGRGEGIAAQALATVRLPID